MTAIFVKNFKLCIFALLVLLYLLSNFVQNNFLFYLIGLITIICIIISYKGSRLLYKIISSIFFLVGFIIYFFTNPVSSIIELPMYLNSNLLLISLLFFLPFISSVIKVGHYDKSISYLLKIQNKHLGQFYFRISIVSYLLSFVLFFAAIPLIFELVNKNFQNSQLNNQETIKNKFISQSILRGFAISTICSPVAILVALAVDITNVNYLSLLPWLLLLMIILFILEWLYSSRFKKYYFEKNMEYVVAFKKKYIKKMIFLIFSLLLFMIAAMLLHKILNLSFFLVVTYIIFPFCLIWSFSLKKTKLFLKFSFIKLKKDANGFQNLLLLFVALGFFNSTISESSIISLFQETFIQLHNQSVILLFIFIQISSLIFSLIGIHPLVTVSVFGILVQPLLEFVNPLSITMVLITSTIANDATGTFNTSVTLMSNLLRINPYFISWWNLFFSLCYGSIGTLIAILLL